jgi:hypothetical protein
MAEVALRPVDYDPFASGRGEIIAVADQLVADEAGNHGIPALSSTEGMRSAITPAPDLAAARTFDTESPEAKGELLREISRRDLAPGARRILEQHYQNTYGEQPPAPVNRGGQIAGELRGRGRGPAPLFPLDGEKAHPVSLTPVDFDPFAAPEPPRGAMGEIGLGLKRGALGQFPQQIGQALKWLGEEPKPITQGGLGSTTYEIGQSLENIGTEYLNRPANQLNPEAHNWLTNSLASGAEMVVPSVAPLAVAAVLPASLPGWVSLGLGATSMGALYGGSQAQQTYEKAIKSGLTPEQARSLGIKTGAVEAGGEILGTMALGWLFGTVGKGISQASGIHPVDAVFDAVKNPAYFKDFAKKLPAVYGTEIGTEMGQNAGEAAIEQAGGIPVETSGGTPWEQAKQAIAPTFGMTTLLAPFGLAGHRSQAQQTTVAAGALQDANAPKEIRTAAAQSVYTALKSEDKAFAEEWMTNAKAAIASGAPVGLDRQFAFQPTAGVGPGSIAGGLAENQVAPSAPLSPIDQARVDAQILKSGGDLPGADDTRLKNATLLSVYGENAAVRHVIEAPEQFAALGDAMLMAAPTVERVRGTIQRGEESRDITMPLLGAINELARLRSEGKSVAEVMAHGVPHDISAEGQQLIEFLDENSDNSQRLDAFLENYLRAIEEASGVPSKNRGRAFQIIEEQRLARRKAEEERAIEQKHQSDEAAREADRIKASEQAQAQNVETEIIKAEAAGHGIQPTHQTAMELAFANAKRLKTKKREAPAGTANRGAQITEERAQSKKQSEKPLSAPSITGPSAKPVETSRGGIELQNRNRSSASSVAQMHSIAGNPDPARLSFSRDMASGAPVVFYDNDHSGGSVAWGKSDTVVAGSGRKIGVRYAAIEADDLLASHRADGTVVAEYAKAQAGKARAVAGNGRLAGVKEAYRRGSAQRYADGIAEDSGLHGVSAGAIRAMRAPVLVRVMDAADVTENIGDESNVQPGAALDVIEQARTDVRRLNLDALEFNETGGVILDSLKRFVQAMPPTEQAGLLEAGGAPSQKAEDRLVAAVFWQAYGDESLTELAAQARDPEARTVVQALTQAAPAMMKLEGAADLDIRGAMRDAGRLAINARRKGVKLDAWLAQEDIELTQDARVVAGVFARNIRSARAIAERLIRAATFAYNEASKAGVDIFGTVPRASRAQVLGALNDTAGQENLEQPGGREPDAGDVGREADQRAGPGNGGQARTDEQGRPALDLTGQTPAEVAARAAQASAKAAQDVVESVKSIVDSLRDSFTLTGSNRQADEAAARGQQELKPSGPLEADQDRAQYGAHEPEEISHRGGENSDERARAVAAQLDLFAESALPGAPAPGEFDTLVAPAKRGTLRVSSDRIDSPQAAAHAFAGLRKEPSEKFQVLVLDKNDKPIAALHLFGGSISHVSVYPREVLTAVYQTPGAAKIWMAHNHPSGVAEPSRADEILTRTLESGLGKDIGVEFAGHIIIAGNKAVVFDDDGARPAFDIPTGPRKFDVPIMERTIRRQRFGARDTLSSPAAMRDYIRNSGKREPGLILMDAQHRVTGWLPMSLPEAGKLRTGDANTGAGRLFRTIGVANPAAVAFYSPETQDLSDVARAVRNVGAALKLLDVQTLDGFVPGPGGGPLVSLAERGLLDTSGSFFSRSSAPFYSELARQVEGAPMNAAPTKGWQDFLRGLVGRGVKQDEIEWSGVNDWLSLQTGRVSKAAVQDYLRQNGVRVEETVLDESTNKAYRAAAEKAARLSAFRPTQHPRPRPRPK